MKTFTNLFNEADSVKITQDYTRYLLEKQYALSKKTMNILLEEDEDEDGNGEDDQPLPFNRRYSGNKVYVHVDVDGRRDIRVVDGIDAAKLISKQYPSVIAYDNGGNVLNLREKLEDGVDLVDTSSFRPKPERTKSTLAEKLPQTYREWREKYEKSLDAEAIRLNAKHKAITGKDLDVTDWRKDSNLRKEAALGVLYNDPNLVSVLGPEEYKELQIDTKENEPLYIKRAGTSDRYRYETSREPTVADIKDKSKIPYFTGEIEGPPNPADLPDVQRISASSENYADKDFTSQTGIRIKDWFSQPENIKTTVAAGAGIGAGMALLKTLLPAAAASYVLPATELGLGAYYAGSKYSDIQSEIEAAKRGETVDPGAKTSAALTGELAVGTPGAIVGGGAFKGRTPRPAQMVEPKPKATEPKPPEPSGPSWNVPPRRDYSTIISPKEPALPTNLARDSALGQKFKLGKDRVTFDQITPGERINMWRELLGFGPKGASKKTPLPPWEKFEVSSPLEAKPETFVEPQTPLASQAPKVGTTITLPKGFRGAQPKFVGLAFTPPAALPKRPSDFESPADYQRAKEQELGRSMSDKEAKASAEEYAKDVREIEAAKVPDRSLLFPDRGPVSLSMPSRASVIGRIQNSPITKAAAVAASFSPAADMATRGEVNIPAIVAKAIENSQRPPEPAGILRTVYKELQAKAPEPETTPDVFTARGVPAAAAIAKGAKGASDRSGSGPSSTPTPKATEVGVPAKIQKTTSIDSSGEPAGSVGKRMAPPNIVVDTYPEDRSMDDIEAARLLVKRSVQQEDPELVKNVRKNDQEAKKNTTEQEKVSDPITNVDILPLVAPVIAPTIQTIINRAFGGEKGNGKYTQTKNPSNTNNPRKGGIPPVGEGGYDVQGSDQRTNVGRGVEDWNLLIKNIFGKNVASVTK